MEEGHARDTGRVLGAEAPFIYGVVIGNRPHGRGRSIPLPRLESPISSNVEEMD